MPSQVLLKRPTVAFCRLCYKADLPAAAVAGVVAEIEGGRMPSLDAVLGLRQSMQHVKWVYLTRFWRMDIHETAKFSLKAHFDKTHPRGIHIGARTYVAYRATVFAHDLTRGLATDTWIGDDCFIGAHSIILPGVRVGNGSIVGAGSVVTRDVPPKSAVAGNPARILRSDIAVVPYGRLLESMPPDLIPEDQTHRPPG